MRNCKYCKHVKSYPSYYWCSAPVPSSIVEGRMNPELAKKFATNCNYYVLREDFTPELYEEMRQENREYHKEQLIKKGLINGNL